MDIVFVMCLCCPQMFVNSCAHGDWDVTRVWLNAEEFLPGLLRKEIGGNAPGLAPSLCRGTWWLHWQVHAVGAFAVPCNHIFLLSHTFSPWKMMWVTHDDDDECVFLKPRWCFSVGDECIWKGGRGGVGGNDVRCCLQTKMMFFVGWWMCLCQTKMMFCGAWWMCLEGVWGRTDVRYCLKTRMLFFVGLLEHCEKGCSEELSFQTNKKLGCISKVHTGFGKSRWPTCWRRQEGSSRNFEMRKGKGVQRVMCVWKTPQCYLMV